MTLLRRRPREVYRVYSEDEYLDGAGSELVGDVGERPVREPDLASEGERPTDRATVSVEPAGQVGGRRRLYRAVGVAMLAGAVGAVSCVVFLNIARAHGGGRARGRVVAAAHPAPIARAAAVAGAQPEEMPSHPAVMRDVETRRSPVPPTRRSPHNPVSRRAPHLPTNPAVHRQIDVAVVVGYVSQPSPGAVPDAPVYTPESAATVSGSTVEERLEFGFER
jgi:hypothetical protein